MAATNNDSNQKRKSMFMSMSEDDVAQMQQIYKNNRKQIYMMMQQLNSMQSAMIDFENNMKEKRIRNNSSKVTSSKNPKNYDSNLYYQRIMETVFPSKHLFTMTYYAKISDISIEEFTEATNAIFSRDYYKVNNHDDTNISIKNTFSAPVASNPNPSKIIDDPSKIDGSQTIVNETEATSTAGSGNNNPSD